MIGVVERGDGVSAKGVGVLSWSGGGEGVEGLPGFRGGGGNFRGGETSGGGRGIEKRKTHGQRVVGFVVEFSCMGVSS